MPSNFKIGQRFFWFEGEELVSDVVRDISSRGNIRYINPESVGEEVAVEYCYHTEKAAIASLRSYLDYIEANPCGLS